MTAFVGASSKAKIDFTTAHIEQHSLALSMVLHLFPGLIALLVYCLLVHPLGDVGFPSMMAWLATIALINIPMEWGVMIVEGYKRNRCLSLEGIILNRQPLKAGSMLLWSLLVFLGVLIAFVLTSPVTNWSETALFSWVPGWFEQNDGSLGGSYSQANLLLFNLVNLFVLVIGISITEEAYFRGYLLPRISRLGLWGVVINSALFSLYHFTTPWALIQRAAMTLPMAYAVYRKRNLAPSMTVHAIANLINALPGIQYLLTM
jgi:membrane protease YdiL (CAAX protease family)